MVKNLMKLTWMFAAAAALSLLLAGCEKNTTTSSDEVDNYTDQAMFEMQERAGCGRGGCFEFVFPITVVFPDETTAEVEDYEGLRTAIHDWKTANPDASERPTFAFPLEVVSEDGEMISVADQAALMELRRQCRRQFGPHRPGKGGRHCFRLVFPLNVAFPDGTTATAEGPRALQHLLREWKRNNQGSETRPELVFPLTVEMQDGTQTVVEDKDALTALKESCSSEG
jgi:hypothetical protein